MSRPKIRPAIRRAWYAGFKRNVAVAMENWLSSVDEPPEEVGAVLRDALEDVMWALEQEHVMWALEQAKSGSNGSKPLVAPLAHRG